MFRNETIGAISGPVITVTPCAFRHERLLDGYTHHEVNLAGADRCTGGQWVFHNAELGRVSRYGRPGLK